MSEQSDGVDFALAAFRDDGEWQVQQIASPAYDSVDSLSHALRRLPGDAGAVGMVAVDEDFFVLVRVDGSSTRVLLSDVTAAEEWELAQSAVDFLGLPPADDEDEQVPAGDLDLLGDLGMHAMDLAVLLDDVELYPDEMLSDIARRARLRRALRRRRRVHVCMRWDAPMRLALDEAREAVATGDVPIGAVVLDPAGEVARPRSQRPRGRGRPDRPRRGRRPARRRARPRRVAADRLHPGRHARAVHDVRRRGRAGPRRTASSSGRTTTRPAPSGSLWDVVRDRRLNHRPEVVGGVLAAESTALLDAFFAEQRSI